MTPVLDPQLVVRLSEVAARRGVTIGEMIDRAVEALLAEEAEPEMPGAPKVSQAADQNVRQAVLANILITAQALDPEPPESPTRTAYREDAAGQAIVEKYRRQGFNL